MATYVLLSTLTPEGRKTVKERPGRISEVNKEIELLGARVVSQFVVLGAYDFVTIIEAPNNETVARVSAELGSRGTIQIMSLPAMSVESFIKGFKSWKISFWSQEQETFCRVGEPIVTPEEIAKLHPQIPNSIVERRNQVSWMHLKFQNFYSFEAWVEHLADCDPCSRILHPVMTRFSKLRIG